MTNQRRRFLKGLSASALAGATYSTLGSALPAFQAHAADTSGYKAVVCLFLFGGMDNHDTILPFDQTSYDRYAEIRSSMLAGYSSRQHDQLLQLTPVNQADFGTRQFALPPQLQNLHTLIAEGNASVIANVGPLAVPTTRSQFENGSVILPKRLFSHNDQQSTWMALAPEGTAVGWGGLMADAAVDSLANNSNSFTAITAAGNNVFQSGNRVSPYPVTNDGAAEFGIIQSLEGERHSDEGEMLYQAVRSALSRNSFSGTNLLQRDIANAGASALSDNEGFNEALSNSTDLSTAFPRTGVGRQLENIARSISIRDDLGMSRQVFFASRGGFDTHSNQANALPNIQTQIDEAIFAFYTAMIELGLQNDVVLFTASDFGRTLAVNGDGTDHGWGGHQFVVGGGIRGNRIFGSMPEYDFDHEQDAGHGRLIPTTSLEQFAAPIASWFGLTNSELANVFPNFPSFGNNGLELF